MSWSVMADVPNPIFDVNGDPYSGAVLKAYLPGTTTSTSIAIAAAGTSPQTTITANAEGKWEVSGNEILPYIDRKHKWGIFANATDATANTPFYMGPFDNVEQVSNNNTGIFHEATIATMTADTSSTYIVGDVVHTVEATTGNGGGRVYDVVLTSGVTPDADLIIIGVANALISFVVRETYWPLLYDGSNAAVELRAGARGGLVRSTTSNQATAFNAVPNGTPTGENKAYSNIRVVAQDIETSPTGTRQFLGMETHYDTDETMRVRHSTRSEGTPTLKHTDYYWQINGNNCMYTGTARGGTGLSAVSIGFFPAATAFKVDFATTTGTSTGVTNYWAASTAYAETDEVALLANDYQYLVCTTAGTSDSTEPGDGSNGGNGLVGATGITDNTAVWTVKSRLLESSADAQPALWMDEQGNTGFGTMNPTALFDFAKAVNFQSAVSFDSTATFDVLNRYSVTASITAAGVSSLDNATALTTEINQVSTVATDTGVRLPTAVAGQKCSIQNDGANTLKIWPTSGDDLGAGVNTNTTLAAGASVEFHSYDSTNWFSLA